MSPLKRLTRSLGDRADAVQLLAHAALARPTRDTYRRYLCDLYGFIVAFEGRFAYMYELDFMFIRDRIKSGRIASDLMALGLTAYERQRLARRCWVPAFAVAHDALGWLYVVERLMLGLPGLRRRLATALPRELELAGGFVGTLPEEIEGSWHGLAHTLEHWIDDEEEMERVTRAGREALECLEEWLLVPAARVEVDADRLAAP
jgi:heme oxygenase